MRIAKILLFATVIAVPAQAIKIERLKGPHSRALTAQARAAGVEVVSETAMARFDPALDAAARAAALKPHGMSVLAELESIGWTKIGLPAAMTVAAGLDLLQTVPGVLEFEANFAYRPVRVPNDRFFWTQYHLDKVDAPTAWDFEVGNSSRVTVAVLDTGIEGSHPDLTSKLGGTSKFCTPGPIKDEVTDDSPGCVDNHPPTAACNHATRVAGVAAAGTNNLAGVSGISWGAQLLSMRVFRDEDCSANCDGNSCATDGFALAEALAHLQTIANSPGSGKIVANLSIGGTGTCPAHMNTAITNSVLTGNMVVVVSAGNDGGAVNAPANCTNAIPVGALDTDGATIASFSSRGAELALSGVVAPGVSLVTTDVGGGVTGGATGTSFSAPLVSGLAALMWSADPALTPAQIKSKLRSTAIDLGPAGNDNVYGGGGVSVCAAVKDASGGSFACQTAIVNSTNTPTSGLHAFGEPDSEIELFPNPFRPGIHGGVTIRFPKDIQGGSARSIKIFTMNGEALTEIPGIANNRMAWDGTNFAGHPVATGVYIVLVKTSLGMKKGRLAVIR